MVREWIQPLTDLEPMDGPLWLLLIWIFGTIILALVVAFGPARWY